MTIPTSMVIYQITNLTNGKLYIGLTTKTAEERWKEHVYLAVKRNSQFAIHRAITKYGQESFQIETIDTAENLDDLINKETKWIETLDTMNPAKGYNMVRQDLHLKHFSDEVKAKISATNKKRAADMEPAAKAALYDASSKTRQGMVRKGLYVGVNKNPKYPSYAMHISYRGKRYRLACLDPEEAAEAYDKLALYLYGTDAKLNFPDKKDLYLAEDLELFADWVQNGVRKQGRRPKKLHPFDQLLPEAQAKALKQLEQHKDKLTMKDIVTMGFLYDGSINPLFCLKNDC